MRYAILFALLAGLGCAEPSPYFEFVISIQNIRTWRTCTVSGKLEGRGEIVTDSLTVSGAITRDLVLRPSHSGLYTAILVMRTSGAVPGGTWDLIGHWADTLDVEVPGGTGVTCP